MRLRNIGVSQWFVFLRYLPFVSLLFWIWMQAAQGGWGETRQFDRAGWSIIAAHAVLVGLMLILLSRTAGLEIFSIGF